MVKGIILTHVDDVLHGSGTPEFDTEVLSKLKQKFKFGNEEQLEFRYVGMNVTQSGDKIVVDQNHYLDSIDLPIVDPGHKDEEVMNSDGQEDFRGVVGKIGWLGGISRPDLAHDHVLLSCKLGKASYIDLKEAVKVVKKLKMENTSMTFPNLGDPKTWRIEGYGDASFKNLPDKTASCGGRVIVVKNDSTGTASVVSWRSKKLKRIALSTTAAEALAANDTISEMTYIKAVLVEMVGESFSNMPMILKTDSKNLWKAVKTTALVEDPRLCLDIAASKKVLKSEK